MTVGTTEKIKALPYRAFARVIMEVTHYSTPTYFLEWNTEVVPVGYATIGEVAKAWRAIELKAAGFTQPATSSNYDIDLGLYYHRIATASVVEGKFVRGRWYLP